jgi:hypothetical protein
MNQQPSQGRSALIGHSGFVGSTLKKQTAFTDFFRSNNIQDIREQEFDLVVCAGISAKKWLANKNPQADLAAIQELQEHLKTIQAKQFILISTVDVFKNPVGVTEDSVVETQGLHAYGLHRYAFENFVREKFPQSLIVRLPGLVGPGLQKNIIFDFLNNNNLSQIDSRHQFQFYPMVNLWWDLQLALQHHISLLHLTSAPVEVGQLVKKTLFREFKQVVSESVLKYDFRTKHGKLYGTPEPYQYSLSEVCLAVRAYFQSEARTEVGS